MNKEDYRKLLLERLSEELMFFELIKNKPEDCSARDIIQAIYPDIHYKRLWYILEKWLGRDIYNYGITLDLGWLEKDKKGNLKGDIYYYKTGYKEVEDPKITSHQ